MNMGLQALHFGVGHIGLLLNLFFGYISLKILFFLSCEWNFIVLTMFNKYVGNRNYL